MSITLDKQRNNTTPWFRPTRKNSSQNVLLLPTHPFLTLTGAYLEIVWGGLSPVKYRDPSAWPINIFRRHKLTNTSATSKAEDAETMFSSRFSMDPNYEGLDTPLYFDSNHYLNAVSLERKSGCCCSVVLRFGLPAWILLFRAE